MSYSREVLFPRTTIVLDQLIFAADTARDRGERSSLKLALLRLIDLAATSAATLVVVDTDENLELLSPRHRSKGLVVPVGATRSWSEAQRGTSSPDDPMRVVFFGLFTPLQGAVVVERRSPDRRPTRRSASP
jgi:hypothetical protein